MIDFTLAELLTGLDLSDNVGDMTDNMINETIVLRSSSRLILNGKQLQADQSFRERLLTAGIDDPNIQIARGHELDAIGMRHGLIRDGYFYEATEVSAEAAKPER